MTNSCVTINPCSMCQPLGAVLALRGIENSIALVHGSQGCSTYIRLHLCHHFREPLDVASSALNEKEAIYGGAKNLKRGLKNIIERYQPELVGVTSTCLAETIADDVKAIVSDFLQKQRPETCIIPVSTPSYKGSHVDGFNRAVQALVETLAEQTRPNHKINLLISSSLSCSDIRYLKAIFVSFGQPVIIMPDYSETLEAPLADNFPQIPCGGTSLEELKDSANSLASLSLGISRQTVSLAGSFLEERYGVKNYPLSFPIGLQKTDEFFETVENIFGAAVPEEYQKERGRLLDAFVDAHRYTFGVETAICGDPDLVAGLTSLALEIGLKPVLIASGSYSKDFCEEAARLTRNLDFEPIILSSTDFEEIHCWIKEAGAKLLIGPSTAGFIAEAERIPLIRVGFPIHDRVGAQRKLVVGYQGAISLVDEIANTILGYGLKKPWRE